MTLSKPSQKGFSLFPKAPISTFIKKEAHPSGRPPAPTTAPQNPPFGCAVYIDTANPGLDFVYAPKVVVWEEYYTEIVVITL